MALRLRVELLTATTPGSGEGRAGTLDRDLVADVLGLPRIPGRRMKGILREAALGVREQLERLPGADVSNWIAIDQVFGETGGSAEIGLQLPDLRLLGHGELAPWVRWGRHEFPQFLHRESVLRAYTEERSQTSIADNGAPRPNTLRRTRLLRRGLEFASQVWLPRDASGTFEAALDSLHCRTLGLACAATKRLGLSRKRGPGRVKLRLEFRPDGAAAEDAWQPLSEAIVAQLAAGLSAAPRATT